MTYDAVDLFAGPGGWDVAARELGVKVLGIESDESACATRGAAGLPYRFSDVRTVSPLDYDAPGLIASPPCQTFSQAGTGAGRAALDKVLEAIHDMNIVNLIPYHLFDDVRTGLVLEPLHWAIDRFNEGIPFEWIALEQVPSVLPVWEAYAGVLRDFGYSVVTSVVSAEEYGVPQTRKRAVLLASWMGDVKLPAATHRKYRKGVPQDAGDPDLKPWVSMADALGWGMTQRPCVTLAATSSGGGPRPLDGGSGARKTINRERAAGAWIDQQDVAFSATNVRPNSTLRRLDEPAPTLAFGHETPSWIVAAGVAGEGRPRSTGDPAPTVTGKGTAFWLERPEQYKGGTGAKATKRDLLEPAPTVHFGERLNTVTWQPSGGRVTPQEAAVLQSFPADYPWQGTKTKQFQQIGNAIPPVLAEALLREVVAA